jgi:hypothetical protein
MTVATDLQLATGVHRRLYLKIDGLEPMLWQDGNKPVPTIASGWSRNCKACLEPPTELSLGIDVGEMWPEMSAIDFIVHDIPDTDGLSYFGKLWGAPALWDQSPHARITDGSDYRTFIAANAATIPLDDDSALPAAPATAYIGQETISYTGKTGTSLTGVTKGRYPCVGSTNFGKTYWRPPLTTSGAQLAVGSVPFAWIGRRVALYVHTYDEQTDDWRSEGETVLLWVGRITGGIQEQTHTDGTRVWQLGCTSILGDLEGEMGAFPSNFISGINIGTYLNTFTITEYDEEGRKCASLIVVPTAQWYAGAVELCKDLSNYCQNTLWTTYGGRTNECAVYFYPIGGVVLAYIHKRSAAWPGERKIVIWAHGCCHALQALGFMADSFEVVSSSDNYGETKSTFYFDDYHPLRESENGHRIYCFSTDELWTNQGDDPTSQAHVMIEDAVLDPVSGKKGAYLATYSSIVGSYLDLQTQQPQTYSASGGYVGKKHGDAYVVVQQVYIPRWRQWSASTGYGPPRGPFELLLYSLLSTGTTDYNNVSGTSYDKLPLVLGCGIQEALVDKASFLAADKLLITKDLSQRSLYVIKEPIAWKELFQREGMLFGMALVWRRGKLAIASIISPTVDLCDVTLNESNSIETDGEPEWPDVDLNPSTVVNQYSCEVVYDISTDKYAAPIIINDVDSQTGLAITKKIEIEHPGVCPGAASSALVKWLTDELIGRPLRFPSPSMSRSLAPTLLYRVHAGDVVRLISTRIISPSGSGSRSTSILATVLNVSWSFQWPNAEGSMHVGTVGLMLHGQYSEFGAPWAQAALVDKSAPNGGLDVANDRLTLIALYWGTGTDPDDGSIYKATDEVLVLQRAPTNPAACWVAGPYGCAKDYEADGAQLLTLEAGAGAAMTALGWDPNKEHVIISADYADVTADQLERGTWQASPTSLLLDGTDYAQRYG